MDVEKRHLGAHEQTQHLAPLLLAKPVLGQHTFSDNRNDIGHELVFLQDLMHHRHGQVDYCHIRLADLNHADYCLISLEDNAIFEN